MVTAVTEPPSTATWNLPAVSAVKLAMACWVGVSAPPSMSPAEPDGAALDPPQNAPAWSGMQDVDVPPLAPSYVSPSGQTVLLPITGDLRTNVPGNWDVPGQVAIQGTPGLPLYLTACIPELLEGDQIEQTYSKAPEGRRQPQSKRGERPVPGSWMITGE